MVQFFRQAQCSSTCSLPQIAHIIVVSPPSITPNKEKEGIGETAQIMCSMLPISQTLIKGGIIICGVTTSSYCFFPFLSHELCTCLSPERYSRVRASGGDIAAGLPWAVITVEPSHTYLGEWYGIVVM